MTKLKCLMCESDAVCIIDGNSLCEKHLVEYRRYKKIIRRMVAWL